MFSDRAHKGSALLIVLGMLAFMVVSAVAFSAFMRSSRLPSSYLRRSISSRMLAKAALAQAIDEIDAAIGDHPHPGVWKNSDFNNSNNRISSVVRLPDWESGNRYHNMNAWLGRVYIGGTTDVARVQDRLIEQYETVPVLSMEALAYIPPSLVNDARYYSRHSPAAAWHSMGFDAGRYAFCALDVSDFFDINVVRADSPRSTNPDERISLNYLFENADHTSAASGSDQWQTFIDGILDSKVPFVSLADWNLAMGDSKFGGGAIQSYFYQYAKKGSTVKDFYQGNGETPEQKEVLSRMSFVTDGWFPEKQQTAATAYIDLADEQNQPFSKSDLENTPSDFVDDVMLKNEGSAIWTRLQESIGKLTKCALWDYLDKDDIPLSLAMPTLERTPMICALSPVPIANGAFSVDGSEVSREVAWKGAPGPGEKCSVTLKVKYDISGFPDVHLKTLVVFPFRNKIPNEKSYAIGGRVSIFLSEADNQVRLRTDGGDSLHLSYQANGNPLQESSVKMVDNAIIAMPLQGSMPQPSSFDNAANGEEGAVKEVPLQAVSRVPSSVTFLTATYYWETVDTHTKDDWPEGGADPIPKQTAPDVSKGTEVREAACNFVPLDANGKPSAAYVGNELKNTLQNSGFSKKLKLNAAVWAWVRSESSNKAVDLVPACVQDDVDLNNLNQRQGIRVFGSRFGSAYPLMRFDLGEARASVLSFNSAACNGEKPGVVSAGDTTVIKPVPKTVYIGDPRYNHAPESWFYVSDTDELSASEWLNRCGARSRDGDIFMMTSDQCVMQSIYECANLPRLENSFYLEGSTKTMMGNYLEPTGNDTQFRQAANGIQGNLANANLMWMTYDPLPNSYLTEGDDFDNSGVVNNGGGFKINPYSPSTNIIMAALANTPLEWRFAADPDVKTTGPSLGDASQFNAKYAWNEYSQGANIDYADLGMLAGDFMNAMRANPGNNWQDVWAMLGWCDVAKRNNGTAWEYLINNIQLGNTAKKARIYNCDRKFLYGFWHDCFAVRQQLFLVFVRAEPMLMGGDRINSVPPQLGARAVALVWRDPERAEGAANTPIGVPPHRTRVLFYRQLE